MRPPKRHHYLPQRYLSGFAEESGLVAVHDRKHQSYRLQKPLDTGVIQHLYSHILPDGRKEAPMEIMLSEIDGCFPSLRAGLEDDTPHLSNDEFESLFAWVTALTLRVPRVLEFFAEIGAAAADEQISKALTAEPSARAFMAEVFGPDSKECRLSLEEIKAYISDLDARYPRSNNVLNVTCELMKEGRALLRRKGRIVILRPPVGKRFITADCGALVYHPNPSNGLEGYLGQDSRILLPLSKVAALELLDGPRSLTRRDIDRRHLSSLNHYIAKGSQRFLIGDNIQRLRAVVETARLPGVS